MYTVYQKVLYNSCFFLFLRHVIQKTKELMLSEASLCFTQKNIFLYNELNQTGLVLFIIQKLFFWVKMSSFFYTSKIFLTMLRLKIFLKYWIILYIFRISLCVTTPEVTNIIVCSVVFRCKNIIKWCEFACHLLF